MSADVPCLAVGGDDGSRPLAGRDVLVLTPAPTAPLNAGNRKRVHEIGRALQARGARVHVVYYAFEWPDTYIPQRDLDAMAATWDSFHVAPVTRPLQAPPEGPHHLIDEWWDAAGLEPLLRWLFQRGRYDAFIVNYAFLSKALELAPPRTLKILDTHDRFAGRLEVLSNMGLPAEYFYTSVEEERKALERADLVWAIKEEEASYFRTLTEKPVITMPHCEGMTLPLSRGARGGEELVIGMVGARNSINHRNAMLFIEQVLPVLRRHLAPVRLRFGGGMCDQLAEMGPLPLGVELAGRFGEAAEFYSTVDAVLVPLAHSTGLKIKAVEAFAVGLPVIAHRHAVEGIPTQHPFHLCDSPQQIAQCCLELAFDRSRLPELEQASRDAYARLLRLRDDALQQTTRRIAERPCIVMAVAPQMALADTAYGQHVREAIDYLRHLAEIVLYADRPLAGTFADWCAMFSWQADGLRMVLSPTAAAGMGIQADRRRSAPFPLFHSVQGFEALMGRMGRAQVWLLDLPEELVAGTSPGLATVSGFLRVDTVRTLARWGDEDIVQTLRACQGLTPVAHLGSRADPVQLRMPGRSMISVPHWYRAKAWTEGAWTTAGPGWVLATPATLSWALALRRLVGDAWPARALPEIVCASADLAALQEQLAQGQQEPVVKAEAVALDDALRLRRLPPCVIDAAGAEPALAVLAETMQRAGVPWIPALRLSGAAQVGGADCHEPQTVGDLFERLADALSPRTSKGKPVADAYRGDAGWQAVWAKVSSQFVLC